MRESDRLLTEALRAAGLHDLVERAEQGEWNDYFGEHDTPQHHLVSILEKLPDTQPLIAEVLKGTFDGTYAESQEWLESDEGRRTFRFVMGKNE